MDPKLGAYLRNFQTTVTRQLEAQAKEIAQLREKRSVEDDINCIPGRRLFYTLAGLQTFTTAQNGARGNPIPMTVSQDGPFVMTHYPFVQWRPSLPSNATNFGIWRPVNTAYLPTQAVTTDLIDISYEMFDGGAERAMQNQAAPPILSLPYKLMPLPVPTLFAPNATIQFIPTYQDIAFNSTGTATTEGTLVVGIPGYRIVTL